MTLLVIGDLVDALFFVEVGRNRPLCIRIFVRLEVRQTEVRAA